MPPKRDKPEPMQRVGVTPYRGNGYVHTMALIGEPPEMRAWHHGDPVYPVVIGSGIRIEAFVTVDAGYEGPTVIGNRTWLMKHVHIGHDAVLGDDCELAPGVVVCGYCKLGAGVKMGVNSCIRPFIKIGEGARIGAGAVVIDDVPPGELWAGNPARKLER